jgi:hypothetical protein
VLNDTEVASKLTQLLATWMREQGVEETISSPLPERYVCQVNKQKNMGWELNMTVDLGGYDMDGVMLDLGFDMNILPKNS